MHIERPGPDSDLQYWSAQIHAAEWDDANEIDEPYTAASLRRYLQQATSVFVVAHEDGTLLGIASASLLLKPWGDCRWLYVDEVDVVVPRRREGVGTAIMQALLAIARDAGCDELWLGTEADNAPAAALYRRIGGEEAEVLGYTFEF